MSDFAMPQLKNTSLMPIGVHCVLELYQCPSDLLNNPKFIQQALREAAQQAKSTLLEEVSHQFHPQGVTAVALLAESHLSVHTWPEMGYVAADVFTCGQATAPEKACEALVQIFQAQRYLLVKVPRGRSLLTARSTSAVLH